LSIWLWGRPGFCICGGGKESNFKTDIPKHLYNTISSFQLMPKKEIPRNRLIKIFDDFSPIRIKYKDIFDMKGLYESLQEWLSERDWNDPEDKVDHWETYYSERIDRSGSKEIVIQWRLEKPAPKAQYLYYYLDIDFHCLALSNVEVMKEGRKMKVNKGEVEITIRAFIEEKYKQEFEKQIFLKHIKEIFADKMYSYITEQRKKELYQEMYELQNFIKQWFKLKRYLPYEETKSFFPSSAWPSHLREE